MTRGGSWRSRTVLLLGEERFERIRQAHVVVVGLGGVGSYAAEALARAGIGRLRLVDCDVYKSTDMNRQLWALPSTLGLPKVEAARRRLSELDPDLELECMQEFFHADTRARILEGDPDHVVDAIDSLSPKVELIRSCVDMGIPVVTSMGAACRTDPDAVRVGPISQSTICPLARQVRRRLRSAASSDCVTAIWSVEPPVRSALTEPGAGEDPAPGACVRGRARRSIGSLSTMPALFGILAANHVIRKLAGL